MSLGRKALIWTVASFLAGALGGWAGAAFFAAPYYFGFFFAWVLVGLAALFAIAAHVAESQQAGGSGGDGDNPRAGG